MANPDHVAILMTGVTKWNLWRDNHSTTPDEGPDLSGLALEEEYWLEGVNFRWTDLRGARLSKVILAKANLYKADLSGADISGAFAPNTTLIRTNLRNCNLAGITLNASNLLEADLTGANVRGADLRLSHLVRCRLIGSDLTASRVYGASVWEAELTGAIQADLVVNPDGEPLITTDNIEIAQFLYLLLNNQRIRHFIDNITSKIVLILGRFTPERKAILDTIRDELRKRDYLPVMFDFEKPSNRTTLETVSTLAHMAKFVIADITDARSVLQELQAIVPSNPSVPVQPIILESQQEPGMFDFFLTHSSVLQTFRYKDLDGLLAAITDKVIAPAEAKVREREEKRV